MPEWYEISYRGYLIDHHSPDPPVVTLDSLNLEEYELMLRKANIDNLLLYCKDHWGAAYYPTKVGKVHPGLRLDYVKGISEICRKNGIAVNAYYSVGFDTHAALSRPEWAVRDENRDIVRVQSRPFPKWHRVCGSTPYTQYMIGQIQEIITWYIPEGLFLDIFDCPICYCQYCEARYKKRYGMEMPKGKDKERYWRELQEFQDRDLRYDLLKDIVDVVRHCERRHVGISINGTHMIFRKELLDLVDYDYAEPWTSYYLSAAFARGVSKGKFPQIGPGGVSNVYDPQNASVFVLAAAQIASQGCRVFMFCGSQHPDGTLDKLEFENLGSAYGEVKKFQNYLLDRDSVKSLAILYSEKTRLFESPSGPDREMGSWYRNNLAGTLELASYCLYPFDVLPEWEIGSVRAYEAVISPNVSCMSDQTVNSLRDYVEEGGILIASSKTSLKDEQGREPENFRLAELFGCDFLRVNDDFIVNPWGSYLHKKPHEIWQNLPDTDLAVTPPFIETKFKNGEVLATHIMPCITMSPEKWVNWWSPPPSYKNGKSQATAFPAVQLNSYGKGKVVYFSFDLFSMSGGFLWPRKFMLQMLEFLLPNPRIRTKASTHEGLGVTYFRRRGEGQIIIHQVNHTVSALRGEIRPIDGGTILVDEEYAMPKNCQLVYPRATKLKVEMTEKGHSIIKVPPVDIHSIIAIKTE